MPARGSEQSRVVGPFLVVETTVGLDPSNAKDRAKMHSALPSSTQGVLARLRWAMVVPCRRLSSRAMISRAVVAGEGRFRRRILPGSWGLIQRCGALAIRSGAHQWLPMKSTGVAVAGSTHSKSKRCRGRPTRTGPPARIRKQRLSPAPPVPTTENRGKPATLLALHGHSGEDQMSEKAAPQRAET